MPLNKARKITLICIKLYSLFSVVSNVESGQTIQALQALVNSLYFFERQHDMLTSVRLGVSWSGIPGGIPPGPILCGPVLLHPKVLLATRLGPILLVHFRGCVK